MAGALPVELLIKRWDSNPQQPAWNNSLIAVNVFSLSTNIFFFSLTFYKYYIIFFIKNQGRIFMFVIAIENDLTSNAEF